MTIIEVTHEQLLGHLSENLSFLKASSASFDSGFMAEAKRLAVTTRVLIHDTGESKSILGQLNFKNDMNFYNTSFPYDSENLAPHHGLVMLKFLSTGGSYVAPLSESTKLPSRLNNYVSFSDWWNEVVINDKEGGSYTREQIVKVLANKDGGAHVDPKIDEDYDELKKNNRMVWVQVISDGATEKESGIPEVELHSMRQIAYELIVSIEKKLQTDD